MKGYTNKEFNLGKGTTLAIAGSRVALFVPRLLGKISEKLILNPIAEIRTGVSHEEIKQEAIGVATRYENEQANKMQPEIDEGQKMVDNWARDERGNVKNHFWYRANSNKLARLLKKQAKRRAKPRIIMVAAAYVQLMRIKDKQYTEQLEREYEEDTSKQKHAEIVGLISDTEREIQAIALRSEELEVKLQALLETKGELEKANPNLFASVMTEYQPVPQESVKTM